MTKRGHISAKRRLELFIDKYGGCHICGGLIRPGEAWELDHIIALAMGGADDESNWGPVHIKCHKLKTMGFLTDLARAKRREAKHLGAKRSRNPLPGGRNDKLKKKISGEVVPR